MFHSNFPLILKLSDQGYRSLLFIYPAEHRHAYGPMMAQLFRDQCREAYTCEGGWGLFKTWILAVLDLGKSVCIEHAAMIQRSATMTSQPLILRRRLIFSVFVLTVLFTLMLTSWQSEYYASSARFAVQKNAAASNGSPSTWPSATAYDPYFIQTEFERLHSKEVLYGVIRRLKLNSEWARYNKQLAPLTIQETYQILSKRLQIRHLPNSALIEVRVISEDKNQAAVIANAIVNEYSNLRIGQLHEAALSGLHTLESELQAQDMKVKAAQNLVTKIREEKQIADTVADNGASGTSDPEMLHRLEIQTMEANIAYNQLRQLYDKLHQMNPAELRSILPTAYPDTLLTELLSRRNQLEVERQGLKRDFSEQHPDVARVSLLLSKVNEQVEDRIQGILAGIQFKVQTLKSERDARSDAFKLAKKKEVENTEKYGAYFAARHDLETQKQIRQSIALRLQQEKLDVRASTISPIQMVDLAEPGLRPVRPNWPLNIMVGILLGTVASIALWVFRMRQGRIGWRAT